MPTSRRKSVEIKAVKHLTSDHEAWLLRYLRNTKFQVGLLINFGSSDQTKRFILIERNK